MKSFDGEVTFTPTKSQQWHLELTPSESKTVVLRGLRFSSGPTEIFPRQLCLVEQYKVAHPLDCCSPLQLSTPQPAVERGVSSNKLCQTLVIRQQAAGTKAAAGCRSPKKRLSAPRTITALLADDRSRADH